VHPQLSACNRFALESICNQKYLQYSSTFNKISSKAKVIRQRSTEDRRHAPRKKVKVKGPIRRDARLSWPSWLTHIITIIAHGGASSQWCHPSLRNGKGTSIIGTPCALHFRSLCTQRPSQRISRPLAAVASIVGLVNVSAHIVSALKSHTIVT